MAERAATGSWNTDAINRGWTLWRRLVEADDPRRAIAALKRDDLRCIVLAQLVERRSDPADGARQPGAVIELRRAAGTG
jgi:hypothetical protein